MIQAQNPPLVSVIALCFNHARFVLECLESIRSQTYQDFELIIIDDHSSDDSVSLINTWVESAGLACTFVAHAENAGVCKSLNEAISLSRGQYICMIATDDKWRSNRIQCHMAIFIDMPSDIAVVYSDTAQMSEKGETLPDTFLQGQRPGFILPSGRVFEDLVDRNFVHPLAATIRKSAICEVGGYDTNLATEDYDMWLRLANRYKFYFIQGLFSDYRIVSTSLTRTLFTKPTAKFAYGQFLLYEKWIPSGLLSNEQYQKWISDQASAAYWLFFHEDPRARKCLWLAACRTKRFRYFLLATMAFLGVKRSWLKKMRRCEEPC